MGPITNAVKTVIGSMKLLTYDKNSLPDEDDEGEEREGAPRFVLAMPSPGSSNESSSLLCRREREWMCEDGREERPWRLQCTTCKCLLRNLYNIQEKYK